MLSKAAARLESSTILQVEIVRFRTDAKSVGDVIVERAATLSAAAVVRDLLLACSLCPLSCSVPPSDQLLSSCLQQQGVIVAS